MATIQYRMFIARGTYIGDFKPHCPKYKPTYVILTEKNNLFFGSNLAECSAILREQKDYTHIHYAGELMPLHRKYLVESAKQRGIPLSD